MVRALMATEMKISADGIHGAGVVRCDQAPQEHLGRVIHLNINVASRRLMLQRDGVRVQQHRNRLLNEVLPQVHAASGSTMLPLQQCLRPGNAFGLVSPVRSGEALRGLGIIMPKAFAQRAKSVRTSSTRQSALRSGPAFIINGVN